MAHLGVSASLRGERMRNKVTKELVVRASGVAVTLAALASIVGAGTKWY
jgi:hypothetical protein